MTKNITPLLLAALLLSACGAAPTDSRSLAGATQPRAVAVKSHVYTLDEMGVGKQQLRNLAKAGITNSADLLAAAASDYGREKLVATTGIAAEHLLEIVNQVDLMRVPGIGPNQSRLLTESGVRTVKDLAKRNPANLQAAVAALNDVERLVERTPSLETVTKWVEQARAMDRIVTY